MSPISFAIHGGAGTIRKGMLTPEKEKAYRDALDRALHAGYTILKNNGTALDAVEQAVIILEDTPLFNAGKGSVFTSEGTHEMDASIMEGSNLKAGAVSMVRGVKNPISLARLVMEKTEHILLAGIGAEAFAKEMKCKFETADYFYEEFRFQQWQQLKDSGKTSLDHSENKERKFGTVGAVACDAHGNLAAATSTGGMTNKKFGRIGDSPLIGAGTYANNKTCAVSCTGSGEFFIQGVVAYDISCLMEYKGMTLVEACEEVVNKKLLKLGGDGGVVAVDTNGNMAMPFNTEGMYRASMNTKQEKLIQIYR